MTHYYIAAAVFAVLNIVSFCVTAADKSFSRKQGHRRVPEIAFVFFGLICAGLGTFLAFFICRHKTRHYALLSLVGLATAESAALVYMLLKFVIL